MSEPFRDPLDPPRVHYSFRPTDHNRVSDKDALAHPDRIEVKQILRDNVAAEARAPSSVPKPALYKSQKKRDFILLIVIPNLLLALLVFFLRKSPIAVVLGTSFMALYTVILIWVMWIVMDTE